MEGNYSDVKEAEMDAETLKHIKEVSSYLSTFAQILLQRAMRHDSTKMIEPERSVFIKYTPKLKKSTYGSDEYMEFLRDMKPALDHHYEHNRHHPEYFIIHGKMDDSDVQYPVSHMNLIDIVEMFCDWLAASKRHKDGNVSKSIEINEKRFNMSYQLSSIFKNTIEVLSQ